MLNETQTQQIIDDVARCDSDLGVMYLSRANEGAVGRVLDRNKLEFYELFEAVPHVFLRFGHPLAGRESVSLDDLYPYPQLSFVQGAYGVVGVFRRAAVGTLGEDGEGQRSRFRYQLHAATPTPIP